MARVKSKGSTDAELGAAELRGREEMRRDGAREVRYDADRDAVVITLNDGNFVGLQRAQIPGLENATPAQVAEVVLSPMTTSIAFEKLDADYAVKGLIRKVLGFNAQQGAAGSSTSPAKKAAAARNGKHGGRPRKSSAAKDAGKALLSLDRR